jgi:hypothetical protein
MSDTPATSQSEIEPVTLRSLYVSTIWLASSVAMVSVRPMGTHRRAPIREADRPQPHIHVLTCCCPLHTGRLDRPHRPPHPPAPRSPLVLGPRARRCLRTRSRRPATQDRAKAIRPALPGIADDLGRGPSARRPDPCGLSA